jgi:hypothetical protein
VAAVGKEEILVLNPWPRQLHDILKSESADSFLQTANAFGAVRTKQQKKKEK